MDFFELIFTLGGFLLLLGIGYVAGSSAERKHYASIRKREEELRSFILVQSKRAPETPNCTTAFVSGSVVIGMDYFKLIYSSICNLFGGSVTPFESLLERARREAVLRMKSEAATMQAQYVCNVKFSTSNIKSVNGKGGGAVEVIAYGTAVVPGP